jgi:hypothetical protein
MDQSKGFSVSFEDTEPAQAICGGRGFIDTRCNPVFDNLNCVLLDSSWDWHVANYPWSMLDGWNLHWQKVPLVQSSSFCWNPGKGFLVNVDQPLDKHEFFWP